MKNKKILPNILLLFFSVAISLLVIEMAARHLGREQFTQNSIYVLTDYSVFSYKPNNVYTVNRPEYVNTVNINSKGLRDYEHSYEKQNNTKRVIVLGDSFVAGEPFSLEKTVSKKLEEILNKNSKNNARFEVLNMGFGGFGPTAEAVLLEKKGIKYNPDLVVLALYMGNDFVKVDIGVSGEISKEVFENSNSLENADFKITKFQKLKNFAFRNYFTYSYIRLVVDEKRLKEKADPLYLTLEIYKKQYPPYIEENLEKLKSILLHLKRYSDDKGIGLLVVLIPTKEQVDKAKFSEMAEKFSLDKTQLEADKAQKIFLQFGKENSILMLDLLPEFSRRNKNNTFYFNIDGHWNERGHELAAELVYEKLINNEFLRKG